LVYATLDPVRLLQDIRARQQRLVDMADAPLPAATATKSPPTIEPFIGSLKTAWREGEPNPATRPKPKIPRTRRRPDPLAAVTHEIEAWFAAEPWRTSRELLDRLQSAYPRKYRDGHLRTLQRRLKNLRRQAAHNLVLGTVPATPPSESKLSRS
jgi:hypothetical protein